MHIHYSNDSLIKKCSCGYDPKKKRQPEHCSETTALLNHLTFPPFNTLEEYRDEKRHMAVLLEIISDVNESYCKECFAQNCYGEIFRLQFLDCSKCCSNPKPSYFDDLKRGNTVAILNPDNCESLIAINIINYDECLVFKGGLKYLYNEANRLLRHVEMCERDEKRECFGCGNKFDNLKQCSRCKMAHYCSPDCQKKCWINGHKSLCESSQDIIRLSLLPRYDYNGKGFRFRESKANENTDTLSIFSSPRVYPLLPKYTFKAVQQVHAVENNVLTSSINKSPQKLKKKMPETPTKKFNDYIESKENMECN